MKEDKPSMAQNSWARVVAWTMSVAIVAMPLASSAQPTGSPLPAEPACCASHEGEAGNVRAAAKPSCQDSSPMGWTSAQVSHLAPDGDPCCSDGCQLCDLPCCNGISEALIHGTIAVVQTGAAAIIPPATASPPSRDPERIFRPPRW